MLAAGAREDLVAFSLFVGLLCLTAACQTGRRPSPHVFVRSARQTPQRSSAARLLLHWRCATRVGALSIDSTLPPRFVPICGYWVRATTGRLEMSRRATVWDGEMSISLARLEPQVAYAWGRPVRLKESVGGRTESIRRRHSGSHLAKLWALYDSAAALDRRHSPKAELAYRKVVESFVPTSAAAAERDLVFISMRRAYEISVARQLVVGPLAVLSHAERLQAVKGLRRATTLRDRHMAELGKVGLPRRWRRYFWCASAAMGCGIEAWLQTYVFGSNPRKFTSVIDLDAVVGKAAVAATSDDHHEPMVDMLRSCVQKAAASEIKSCAFQPALAEIQRVPEWIMVSRSSRPWVPIARRGVPTPEAFEATPVAVGPDVVPVRKRLGRYNLLVVDQCTQITPALTRDLARLRVAHKKLGLAVDAVVTDACDRRGVLGAGKELRWALGIDGDRHVLLLEGARVLQRWRGSSSRKILDAALSVLARRWPTFAATRRVSVATLEADAARRQVLTRARELLRRKAWTRARQLIDPLIAAGDEELSTAAVGLAARAGAGDLPGVVRALSRWRKRYGDLAAEAVEAGMRKEIRALLDPARTTP